MPKQKTITVDLAERLNAAAVELAKVSDGAVERMRLDGSSEFLCSNFKQAILGLDYLAKFVRDFAGASATAPIEAQIKEMLDSVNQDAASKTATRRGSAVDETVSGISGEAKPAIEESIKLTSPRKSTKKRPSSK